MYLCSVCSTHECLWVPIKNTGLDLKGGIKKKPHYQLHHTLGRTWGGSFHSRLSSQHQKTASLSWCLQLFKILICEQSCSFWRHTMMSTVCNLFAFTVDYGEWSLRRQRQHCVDLMSSDLLSSLDRKGSFLFFWTIGLEKEKHKRRLDTGAKPAPRSTSDWGPQLPHTPNTLMGHRRKFEECLLSLKMFYVSF